MSVRKEDVGMVKKLGVLGFIVVVVAAASMVCAESYTAGIPAPQPTVMPASAPAMCGPVGCAPGKLTTVKVPMMVPGKPKEVKVTTQVPATKTVVKKYYKPTWKKQMRPVQVYQPQAAPPPPPPKPKKLTTSIQVKMKYPQMPPRMAMAPPCGGPAPIPVAVPMWKFVVPWPPFVYYLPVE
jgi:hypothetical protein